MPFDSHGLPGPRRGRCTRLVVAWVCACLQVGVQAGEPRVLPDLVVTASPAAPTRPGDVLLEEATGHVTRIARPRFEDRVTDLGQVLATQAGVQVRRTGGIGSFSTATLRGASAQQVQVLLDGLPLNGVYGGIVNLGEIPLGQVRDVSIYRGTVPIQFARGGIGGAVDIRTLRPGDTAPHTEVSAGGGSFGTLRGALLHLGRYAGLDTLFSAEAFHTDNDFSFTNDRGTAFNPTDDFPDRRHNAAIDQVGALFKTGRTLGTEEARLDGLVTFLQRREGLPTRDNSPFARASLRTQNVDGQLRWTLRGAGEGDWDTALRLFAGRRAERYDDRDSQIGLAPQLTDDTTWRYGLQGYAERLTAAGTWSGNLQLTRETYRSRDVLRGRRGLEAGRTSVDAGAQFAWFGLDERLLLSPAVRGLWLDETATGEPGGAQAWITPQLGLRFDPSAGAHLRANAAYYVRPPAFFERFGDRGFVVGNPRLRAETGTNVDLGGRLEGGDAARRASWRLGLTGFYSDVEDLIAFVYDARGVGRAVNIGRAEILGLEAETQVRLASGTRVGLNLTWQDARNRTPVAAFDGKRLPGRYRTTLNLELEQSIRRLRLTYRLHYAEGLFYDRPNLLPADTVLRHDLALRLDLGSWRLLLQVDNLSDENFQQFNGYPTPGRAWYATLSYHSNQGE